MTVAVANTALTNTVDYLRNRVNELATAMSNVVLTIDGGVASGNLQISNSIEANNVYVKSSLRGGNNGVANILFITSNVTVNSAMFTAQTALFASAITIGNGSVNSTSNSTVHTIGANVTLDATQLRIGNSTSNSVINSLNHTIGANVTLDATQLRIGNATANAVMNSTGLAVGANVSLSQTTLAVGNSSVNSTINSTSHTIGANLALSLIDLRIGNSSANAVVNSTSHAIGANVILNQSLLAIGNSSVNATMNSSSLFLASGNIAINSTGFFINNVDVTTLATMNTVSGNLAIQGSLDANNVYVLNALRGGNTSVANILYVTSNAVVNSSTFTIGNSSVNILANTTTTSWGANVVVNNSRVLVGNSTVNSSITATNIFVGNSSANAVVNSTGIYLNSVLFTTDTLINVQTSGTSAQIVDQFALATFRGAEYLFNIKDNGATSFSAAKLLVIHDGTLSYIAEYGVINTNTALGTFTTDLFGANCRVFFTPEVANTQVKGTRSNIAV